MKNFIVLLFAWFLLASCVTLKPKPVDPQHTFDTEVGFRFQTPPSGPWYEIKASDGTGIIMGREPSDLDKRDGSTVITEVRFGFVDLKQFGLKSGKDTLKFFEKTMSGKDGNDRFERTKSTFTPLRFKNAECLKFESVGFDTMAKSNQGERLVMSNRGLICLHPKDQSRYIRMAISQRRPFSRGATDFSRDEKTFHDSLIFDDIAATAGPE